MKRVICKPLNDFQGDVNCNYAPRQMYVGVSSDGIVQVGDSDGDILNNIDVVRKLYNIDADFVLPQFEFEDGGELIGIIIIYDDDDELRARCLDKLEALRLVFDTKGEYTPLAFYTLKDFLLKEVFDDV